MIAKDGNKYCDKCKIHLSNSCSFKMTNKQLEETHPSLTRGTTFKSMTDVDCEPEICEGTSLICKKHIQKYTLDKQKVKDAIEKVSRQINCSLEIAVDFESKMLTELGLNEGDE